MGGGLPTAEVLSVSCLNKPKGVGDIGPSQKGYRIRRLRRLNNVPAAMEEIWLDADRCQVVSKDDLPDSLYLFYKEKPGFGLSGPVTLLVLQHHQAGNQPNSLHR